MLHMCGLMVNTILFSAMLAAASGGLVPGLYETITEPLIASLESDSAHGESCWEDLIEETDGTRYYNQLALLKCDTFERKCTLVDMATLPYGPICMQIKRNECDLHYAMVVYDEKLTKQEKMDYTPITQDYKNGKVIVGTRQTKPNFYYHNKDAFYGKDIIFRFEEVRHQIRIFVHANGMKNEAVDQTPAHEEEKEALDETPAHEDEKEAVDQAPAHEDEKEAVDQAPGHEEEKKAVDQPPAHGEENEGMAKAPAHGEENENDVIAFLKKVLKPYVDAGLDTLKIDDQDVCNIKSVVEVFQ